MDPSPCGLGFVLNEPMFFAYVPRPSYALCTSSSGRGGWPWRTTAVRLCPASLQRVSLAAPDPLGSASECSVFQGVFKGVSALQLQSPTRCRSISACTCISTVSSPVSGSLVVFLTSGLRSCVALRRCCSRVFSLSASVLSSAAILEPLYRGLITPADIIIATAWTLCPLVHWYGLEYVSCLPSTHRCGGSRRGEYWYLAPPSPTSATVLFTDCPTQFHSLSFAKQGMDQGLRTMTLMAKSELCVQRALGTRFLPFRRGLHTSTGDYRKLSPLLPEERFGTLAWHTALEAATFLSPPLSAGSQVSKARVSEQQCCVDGCASARLLVSL